MKVKPGVVITPTMWASRRLGQKECDDFKVRQGYIGRSCLNRTRKRKVYETLRYGIVAGSRVRKSLDLNSPLQKRGIVLLEMSLDAAPKVKPHMLRRTQQRASP